MSLDKSNLVQSKSIHGRASRSSIRLGFTVSPELPKKELSHPPASLGEKSDDVRRRNNKIVILARSVQVDEIRTPLGRFLAKDL
jgi:hypothetical protein